MHFSFPRLSKEEQQNSTNTCWGDDLFLEPLGEEKIPEQKANNYHELTFSAIDQDCDSVQILLKCQIYDEQVSLFYFDSLTLISLNGRGGSVATELVDIKLQGKDYIIGKAHFSHSRGYKLCYSLNKAFEKGPFTIAAVQVPFKETVINGTKESRRCGKERSLLIWKVERNFTSEELESWHSFLKKRKRNATRRASRRKGTPNTPTASSSKKRKKPEKETGGL